MFELSMFMCIYDGLQPVHCYEGQTVDFIPRAKAVGLPMPNYVAPVWDLAIEACRTGEA